MGHVKLHLVVAMCSNRGIGVNGRLPWRIKGDMAFFKRITTETKSEGRQNAVLMGRKTWESIPAKFRPLPNRINVVISRTMKTVPDGVHVASSWEEAMELVSSTLQDKVEDVHVIGGSSLYQLALESDHPLRIYLTDVLADFECDTFLPKFDDNEFTQVSDSSVDSSIQTDETSGIQYKFTVYERPEKTGKKMASDLPPVFVMAAIDEARAIGHNQTLPWPSLKKDYIYYTTKTSETSSPEKKVVRIKGRFTWEESGVDEKKQASCINIIISNTLTECPEHAHYVVKSFDEALELAQGAQLRQQHQVEHIWVMGGQKIYEEALNNPCCQRLYVTRIFGTYPGDRFFPPFEHNYQQINDPTVDASLQEDNGIKYRFEVYERK